MGTILIARFVNDTAGYPSSMDPMIKELSYIFLQTLSETSVQVNCSHKKS